MNDDNLHHIAAARMRRAREPRHDREYTLAEIDAKEQQDADDLARGIRQVVAESKARAFAKTEPAVHFPSCIGNCDQGRKICVTPRECRGERNRFTPTFWVALVILSFWAVIGFGVYLIWGN